MTLRTVVGIMALAVGVTTSAFATSAAPLSPEAAVAGAAEAVTRGDAKALQADPGHGDLGKEGADSPVIESDCLKEGEPCNVITNRCCPGYTCQGGLAATCTATR